MNDEIKPSVDMPATVRIGSDRYAAKVTWVNSSGTAIRAEYGYSKQVKIFAKLRGQWRNGHYTMTLGEAVTELDPSF
jgi:hypothetical protein